MASHFILIAYSTRPTLYRSGAILEQIVISYISYRYVSRLASFQYAEVGFFWSEVVELIEIMLQNINQKWFYIPLRDNRSFSLSRNKKLNWKPSSGRNQENEMLEKD